MPLSSTGNLGSISTHQAEGLHYLPCFPIPSFYKTVPASLDFGQSNILVPRQVLWDLATCDEDPSSALRWEGTAIVTPAVPWESLLAAAHRKEKVLLSPDPGFPPRPSSHAAPDLTPLLQAGTTKQYGNSTQPSCAGSGAGPSYLVQRGAPASDSVLPTGPGSLGTG